MATLHFTNVTSASDGKQFATVDEAVTVGRDAGFEFSVVENGRTVVSWSVFGGLKRW